MNTYKHNRADADAQTERRRDREFRARRKVEARRSIFTALRDLRDSLAGNPSIFGGTRLGVA